MKKKLLIVTLIIGIIGIGFFYYITGKDTIKIGFVACLTGDASELGVNAMYGAKIAVEEINASGGISGRLVELIIKNDHNDSKIALEVCKELNAEGVTFIIGPLTSGMAELLVPYINREKMLVISPTISRNDLTGLDDYFIRLMPTNKSQADFVAENMRSDGVKDVAVIYESLNQSFSKTYKEYFEREFISLGGNLVYTDTFTTGEFFEAKRYLDNLEKKGVQSVLFIGNAYDSAIFFQHLSKNEMTQSVYLSQWAMTADLFEQSGNTSNGGFVISYQNRASEKEAYLKFKEKYQNIYGKEPSFSSSLAYESMNVLKEGIKASSTLETVDVKSKILEIQEYQGLQGKIIINRYGDVVRDIYLYEIYDGKFNLAK